MSPTSSLAARLTPRQRTLIILALSLGGFAIGTSEFASMGLMLEISRGLSISETQVGHLISAYAIGVSSVRRSSPSWVPASRAASSCWR